VQIIEPILGSQKLLDFGNIQVWIYNLSQETQLRNEEDFRAMQTTQKLKEIEVFEKAFSVVTNQTVLKALFLESLEITYGFNR